MSWTLKELTQALHLEYPKNEVAFERLWSDTRNLQAGDCYLAIKGENFNGHQFIAQAIAKGAVALVVSEKISADIIVNIPIIQVEDTRIALGKFATWHRLQMPLKKLLAVTGSNGKTTVKMMLQSVLSSIAPTLATAGNFNNDFGVPRTLLEIQPTDYYAVIEMGASGLHEISYLTNLAQSDVALITNASDSHLEGFGSLQGIIETKGEIYQGLKSDGIGILNRDSVGYEDWLKICQNLKKTILTFGKHSDADVRVSEITTSQEGIQFNIFVKDFFNQISSNYIVKMSVLGQHNAMNAASVVVCCLAAELSMEQIIPGLVEFSGVEGRLKHLPYKKGVLIDDAYNANPASVKAGIDTLVSLSGQAILCLGDMAELGEKSESAHKEIALYAKQQGIKKMYLLGELTPPMVSAFGDGSSWYSEHALLVEELNSVLEKDVSQVFNILVKGSRSSKMDRVVQQLLETQEAF